MDMTEAQLLPEDGSKLANTFHICDVLITTLFSIDLALNAFSYSENYFRGFYAKTSNWFDCFIVVTQLFSLAIASVGEEMPGLKILRVLRIQDSSRAS